MERVPEQEAMSPEEETAFATDMDDGYVDGLFVDRIMLYNPRGSVLDVGCGPGRVLAILLERVKELDGTAVDLSPIMIECAKREALRREIVDRMKVVKAKLPEEELGRQFDFVMSRSVLHHFPNPHKFWEAIEKHTKLASIIVVYDFMRPEFLEEIDEIVEKRIPTKTLSKLKGNMYNHFSIMKKLLRESLMSAFTIEEIEEQLRRYKLLNLQVKKEITNYHLTIEGVKCELSILIR